jgi:GDPmannose 4,6-dehydratase
MKKALITGITGQDGSYLAELLLDKGYEVAGVIRRLSVPNTRNIEHLLGKIKLYDGDLSDQGSLNRAVKDFQPDEVYNLAAQSFVKTSWPQPILTGEITGLGAVRMLEALRDIKPDTRFYQASSSEMFGNNPEEFLNENSAMLPHSPYAIAKLYAHKMTQNYRDSYGMFTCNGILFNHESPRRGIEFITRKITYSVACVKSGVKTSKMSNEEKEPLVRDGKIKFGNLDSKRDWGYAKDYVEMMWKMLQQETPDDYVIATGVNYSVREFLQFAFAEVGITDWEQYIEIDERFKRPADLTYLRGNAAKAKEKLGWEAATDLKQLIKIMIESDLELVKKYEQS